MPLRLVSDEEAKLLKGQKTIDLRSYEDELRTLPASAWAEVTAEPNISARALRRRYTLASKNTGLPIRYKRVGERLYLSRTDPAAKRGGRRKGAKSVGETESTEGPGNQPNEPKAGTNP
ncbi:MAG: hypothetical protein HY329_25400 [Chloroflexi bacterium]|nr:hypothetical protein [Chloroflexota bacterium]